METEAYMGPTDIASHSTHGPTSRAEPMFGEPGHAYVYFTYGMHHCMNIVTEPAGSGTAVLIRGIEPLEGANTMRSLRQRKTGKELGERDLTNGPGKLCQALGIDTRFNKADLAGNEIWLEEGTAVSSHKIATTARVGIREGREHPWRFYLKGSGFVSKHPNY